MKTCFFAIFFLSSSSLLASDLCSKKEIILNGFYGKYKSPLIRMWSEASGNFTGLGIASKEKFSKIVFVLNNGGEAVSLPLKDNRTQQFNFISYVHDQKMRPTQLTINVLKNDQTIACEEEVTLIEKDDMNGVLKKP